MWSARVDANPLAMKHRHGIVPLDELEHPANNTKLGRENDVCVERERGRERERIQMQIRMNNLGERMDKSF